MKAWKQKNHALGAFFVLVVAMHAGLLLIPVAKKAMSTAADSRDLQIRLTHTLPQEAAARVLPDPSPPAKLQPDIPALEELPAVPERAVATDSEVVNKPPPAPSSPRVLSSQFDYAASVHPPLFGETKSPENVPDFYLREQDSLEMVLNQPSLQLPFKDTRIYLVDSYDAGIAGSVERFWDSVSVPFGFTTKNNTRVQCVWVLVVAGCGWGHKSLFHRPAKRREPASQQSIENT